MKEASASNYQESTHFLALIADLCFTSLKCFKGPVCAYSWGIRRLILLTKSLFCNKSTWLLCKWDIALKISEAALCLLYSWSPGTDAVALSRYCLSILHINSLLFCSEEFHRCCTVSCSRSVQEVQKIDRRAFGLWLFLSKGRRKNAGNNLGEF